MDLTVWAGRARRGLGLAVLAFSLLPVHRVLDRPDTGQAGAVTVRLGDATLAAALWGGLLVAVAALALGRFVAADPWRLADPLDRALARLSGARLAGAAAVLGALVAVTVGQVLFAGLPTLLDEMAQLVHARYLATGSAAGPVLDPAAAWLVQNTLVTGEGWVSQYPPFHTAVLGLGLAGGVPWLVGPLLVAVLVFFTGRVAAVLLPDAPGAVRWGTVLVAASPFVLVLGAGYLSHVTAAALGAVGLWAGLSARDGKAGWALVVGLAAGAVVATRPLTGLVLAGLFSVGVWLPRLGAHGGAWLARRLALALAASLGPGLWLASYNARFFGGPFNFGYTAAQGPAHGPGFHPDPWGNAYGPLEALAYSAADVLQLGVHLFETPVPWGVAVGATLLLAPRLDAGVRLLTAWALLPLAVNALYWHHGYHLGPRMLYEAAPAWILLGVVGVASARRALAGRWPGRALGWAVVLSAGAALALGVGGRLASYRWSPDTLARIQPDRPAEPAVVFVHGGWSGRLSARLAGLGMRLDSVETALRRNDGCRVEGFVGAWESTGSRGGAQDRFPLDFRPLPGTARGLAVVPAGPGSTVRVDTTSALTDPCLRQARSDARGVVELAPLLWQDDLPGMAGTGVLWVRDLGPDANAGVLNRHPDRVGYVLAPREPDSPPALMPYAEGMRMLWGEEGPGGP